MAGLARVRCYVDEQLVGPGLGLMALRSDIVVASHPPIAGFPRDDPDWIPEVAVQGWVVITNDKHIRTRPGEAECRMTGDDGQPAVFLLARDGSRAEVATTATARGYPVRQYGPQRLWDRVEEAAAFWNEQGRPSYERFGLTATPQGQHVWYDQPCGPHHWPLLLS
ncbi:MAG: hypothetical protein ACRDRE_06665 [Pseudonocardiaceae bacterium]